MKKLFDFEYELKKGDCHPELPRGQLYHSMSFGEGSLSYEEAVFMYGLVVGCKPDVVIETGTETGASTLHLFQALVDGCHGRLVSVDDCPVKVDAAAKRFSREFTENPSELSRLTLLNGNSLDILKNFDVNAELKYLFFLDTFIPTRPLEMAIIKERFPKGSIIALHDTDPRHPHGPMEIEKHFPEQEFFVLPSPRGLTLLTLGLHQ